jgi:hypothetical protein
MDLQHFHHAYYFVEEVPWGEMPRNAWLWDGVVPWWKEKKK